MRQGAGTSCDEGESAFLEVGARSVLTATEDKLRAVFASAPIGIGTIVGRVFVEVNPRFCEMVGYSRDELVGRSARFLYPNDEEFARVGAAINVHPEANAGEHVRLVVSDSGVGMSPQVQAHLFEPFYTTKEKGHGTGLGLSTVYGIVKQAGGFINVYSELGTGSSFKVYWPRVLDKPAVISPVSPASSVSGSETILVVEDEEMLRQLIRRILQHRGFRVHTFATSEEACHWCRTTQEHVDLLLTDVVLPGINGRMLYESLTKMRSDLKVLYMSGYTDNVIAHRGVLDQGTQFIQKPFTIDSILAKVRSVLDREKHDPDPD